MKPVQKILIIVFFSIISSGLTRANTYTLLIGMDVINDSAYLKKYNKEYDKDGTSGVYKDIISLKRITGPNKHIVTELRGKEATREAILKAISDIGELIKVGDQFLFYYSGHGDFIPDQNGDEKSKFDQVMVAYDDFLVDDEIDLMMVKYFTKTKNIMIVDACHSGSSYKNMSFFIDFKLGTNKNKFTNELLALKQLVETKECNITTILDEPYDLLYFGATPDGELAQGDHMGGLLTLLLNNIVRDVKENGEWNKYSYEKLACELSKAMKKKKQNLQFLAIGRGAKDFAKLVPFKTY